MKYVSPRFGSGRKKVCGVKEVIEWTGTSVITKQISNLTTLVACQKLYATNLHHFKYYGLRLRLIILFWAIPGEEVCTPENKEESPKKLQNTSNQWKREPETSRMSQPGDMLEGCWLMLTGWNLTSLCDILTEGWFAHLFSNCTTTYRFRIQRWRVNLIPMSN